MINIMRSVLLPPICGPQLMPETSNGAGELHVPELVLQVATPFPCSPPTTKAPLISVGITATHFAPLSTLFGTPLSGEAVVMFCTVSGARVSSSLAFVLSFLACLHQGECAEAGNQNRNQEPSMNHLPHLRPPWKIRFAGRMRGLRPSTL